MTDRDQLRDRIEWVLGVHYRTSMTARGWLCDCGQVVPAPEFDRHVADAVLDALGLEQVGTADRKDQLLNVSEEWSVIRGHGGNLFHRPVYIVREADIPPGEEHPS